LHLTIYPSAFYDNIAQAFETIKRRKAVKRIVYLLLCSVLLVSMMGLTIAENVETPVELVEIAPIKAIAISEVFELGQAISAVALEFPGDPCRDSMASHRHITLYCGGF